MKIPEFPGFNCVQNELEQVLPHIGELDGKYYFLKQNKDPLQLTHLVVYQRVQDWKIIKTWEPCFIATKWVFGAQTDVNKNTDDPNELITINMPRVQAREERKRTELFPFNPQKCDLHVTSTIANQPQNATNDANVINQQSASILQQLVAQIQTNSTNSSSNKKDMTELLYLETITDKFEGTFPVTNDKNKFFEWCSDVSRYIADNPKTPSDRIFQNILDKVPKAIKSAWHQYKSNQFQSVKDAYFQETGEDLAKFPEEHTKRITEFQTQISTLSNFEKFALQHLKIKAKNYDFEQQMHEVHCYWNEEPLATFTRVSEYFDQIASITTKLNSIKEHDAPKIRHVSDNDKLDEFMRIFCFENNDPKHNNRSVLNEKVSREFHKAWTHGKLLSTIDIQKLAKKASVDIVSGYNPSDKDKNWKHYNQRRHWNIFAINTSYNPTKNDRKRTFPTSRGNNAAENPLKKQRVDIPCRNGANCTHFIRFGECLFQHTPRDLATLRQKHANNNNNANQSSNHSNTFNRNRRNNGHFRAKQTLHHFTTRFNKSSDRQQRKSPCSFGATCHRWQNGKCPNYHRNTEMTCSHCHKPGHSASRCYQKNKGSQPQRTTYNPNNTANIQKMYQNIQKTTNDIKKALAMKQTANDETAAIPNLNDDPIGAVRKQLAEQFQAARNTCLTLKTKIASLDSATKTNQRPRRT